MHVRMISRVLHQYFCGLGHSDGQLYLDHTDLLSFRKATRDERWEAPIK